MHSPAHLSIDTAWILAVGKEPHTGQPAAGHDGPTHADWVVVIHYSTPGGLNYLSHRSSGPQYELICIQPIRDRAYSFAYSQSTAGDSTLGIY